MRQDPYPEAAIAYVPVNGPCSRPELESYSVAFIL